LHEEGLVAFAAHAPQQWQGVVLRHHGGGLIPLLYSALNDLFAFKYFVLKYQ
jgi:hypothetical protein